MKPGKPVAFLLGLAALMLSLSSAANSQASLKCSDYHYSTCPAGCMRICVPSCQVCDDCDGAGSCIPQPNTTCAGEAKTIPVIPNPPECCYGLEMIKPKSQYIVGIMGICTANCGDGFCSELTETPYNCPKDCREINGFCGWSDFMACSTDNDCMISGCSGQVCGAVDHPTTCEWRDCYEVSSVGCGCVNGMCQWNCLGDNDGDRACDDNDNCPYHFNPDQADTDMDTKGDRCDITGDVQWDCVVNAFDLASVGIAFGSSPGSAGWNPSADVFSDGVVNIFDLAAVAVDFGRKC